LPVEINCHGEESPILVNLVQWGTDLKINEEIGKFVGDRFAIKL
jgi:hypothetical protein